MTIFDSSTLAAIGQLILDAVLFLAIWVLYKRIRHMDPEKIDYLASRLDENARLIQGLEGNLREKERISIKLTGLLEQISKGDKAGSAALGPMGEDQKRGVRERAVTMWMEGKDIQEIALTTGLSPGEIELLANLTRSLAAEERATRPLRS